MKPSRSTQQVPEMLEREEMPSTSSTELQLLSPQRSPCKISEVPKWSLWCCFFYTDATTLNSGGPNTLKEEQQQEDRPIGLKKIFFNLKFFSFQNLNIQKIDFVENEKFQLLNFHDINYNKTLNLHLIANPVNSREIYSYTENMISVKHKRSCMFWHILTTSISWNFTKLFLFLPSVKKNCNLHSMTSTTANIEDLLASHFLPNYSPFDFSTVNLRQTSHTQKSIPWLKDRFKKQTNCCDKMELFNQTMKFVSNVEKELSIDAGGRMQSLLKYYHEKHKAKEKQYAFAVVLMKNSKYNFFPAVYPKHQNKKKNSASSSTENTKHSEEILIGQIDGFLQNHGTKAQSILIYTLNSPCLKREKDIVPCMFQLLDAAHQWHSKYGIFTYVAFTNFWGLSGPNYFKDLTFSSSPSPSSDFYPYIETCEKISFKLDSKDFRENVLKSGIYKAIKCVETKERNKLHNGIQSAICDLMTLAGSSSGLRKEHLDRGVKKITSFPFHQQVQHDISDTLTEKWKEMVRNSSMSPVREKITTDFNTAVVQLFLKDHKSFPGNSRPLRIHQVLRTC